MTTQPEALRLADWLEDQYDPSYHLTEAAAELRRLNAQNKALQEQHIQAHENTATILGALTEISLLTPLGGEVAEYSDVIEAVRRLHAQRQALLEALKDAARCVQSSHLPDQCGHDWDDVIKAAEGEQT